jgi:threonine/homoserine/homoserine lactone efflux protein
MSLIIFKGIVLGFVYAVIMVSGTVWTSQVTLKLGLWGGLRVVAAIISAQILLSFLALLAIFGLLMLPFSTETPLRLISTAAFFYMAYKMLRAPQVKSLELPDALLKKAHLFRATLVLSLTMPMRLGGYLAFGVASGMLSHELSIFVLPWGAVSVGVGATVWFVYIAVLAAVFAHKVPENVTLRSINKLNQLAAIVYLMVGAITLIPLWGEL